MTLSLRMVSFFLIFFCSLLLQSIVAFLKCMLRFQTASELVLFGVNFRLNVCNTYMFTYLHTLYSALYEIVTKWTHSLDDGQRMQRAQFASYVYFHNLAETFVRVKCTFVFMETLLLVLFHIFLHFFSFTVKPVNNEIYFKHNAPESM